MSAVLGAPQAWPTLTSTPVPGGSVRVDASGRTYAQVIGSGPVMMAPQAPQVIRRIVVVQQPPQQPLRQSVVMQSVVMQSELGQQAQALVAPAQMVIMGATVPAGAVVAAPVATLAQPDFDFTDMNPKHLARATYQQQVRHGGNHTLRAKRVDVFPERKGMEVRPLTADAPPFPHHLRYTSVPQLAASSGGTYELCTDTAGRRAVWAGDNLYTVQVPTAGGQTAVYAVRESRGNPIAQTAYPKIQRAHRETGHSPDWNFSKQIFEAKTKKEVQRADIREGMGAASVLN